MNINKLIIKTQGKIKEFRSSGNKGSYPESVSIAVLQLSKQLNGADIASSLGVSSSFIYKVINLAKENKKNKEYKKRSKPITSKEESKIPDYNQNLQFLDITGEIKSFVKEDLNPLCDGNSNSNGNKNRTTKMNEDCIQKNNYEYNQPYTTILTPSMKFTTRNGMIIEIFQ